MFSVIREFLSARAEYERNLLCLYVVVDGFTPCLYGPNAVGWNGKPVGRIGCAHAGRQDDWLLYAMGLKGSCPSFWLDQNRFQRV